MTNMQGAFRELLVRHAYNANIQQTYLARKLDAAREST